MENGLEQLVGRARSDMACEVIVIDSYCIVKVDFDLVWIGDLLLEAFFVVQFSNLPFGDEGTHCSRKVTHQWQRQRWFDGQMAWILQLNVVE